MKQQKKSSDDIFSRENSKGVFLERLAVAIKPGDIVTIACKRDEDKTDRYHIEVLSDTEDYGTLRGRESLYIGKATPGALVSAIEKAKEKITGTVQMMLEAQDGAKE